MFSANVTREVFCARFYGRSSPLEYHSRVNPSMARSNTSSLFRAFSRLLTIHSKYILPHLAKPRNAPLKQHVALGSHLQKRSNTVLITCRNIFRENQDHTSDLSQPKRNNQLLNACGWLKKVWLREKINLKITRITKQS